MARPGLGQVFCQAGAAPGRGIILNRNHAVQRRVPHAKVAKVAKDFIISFREQNHRTVGAGLVIEPAWPPFASRPWREISSAWIRIRWLST